ncbi:hypothetical protein EYF80_058997 [Liparis tanakae]|uniref:Uncharacterized protein n=1 Tax=Liparis tanakae TaxID=230148 RepID=A0A4Z2EQK5_9TELE|nr:hypothetical protein EYF80_058997 [Liparis tanakae]
MQREERGERRQERGERRERRRSVPSSFSSSSSSSSSALQAAWRDGGWQRFCKQDLGKANSLRDALKPEESISSSVDGPKDTETPGRTARRRSSLP